MALIFVDVHEPREVAGMLEEMGVETNVRAISPGDYLVGDVGVERKSLGDFFQSIVRKRLFDQLERLVESYPRQLLVVEGNLDEVSLFRNPGVFWGAFLFVSMDMGVPIIFTPELDQTAVLLATLEQKLFKEGARGVMARYKPRFVSDEALQRFIIQGLPGIGETLADKLLSTFKTVRGVFSTGEVELKRVPKIGEKKAREITRIINLRYKGQKELYPDAPR